MFHSKEQSCPFLHLTSFCYVAPPIKWPLFCSHTLHSSRHNSHSITSFPNPECSLLYLHSTLFLILFFARVCISCVLSPPKMAHSRMEKDSILFILVFNNNSNSESINRGRTIIHKPIISKGLFFLIGVTPY